LSSYFRKQKTGKLKKHLITAVRHLTDSTFVLQLERKDLPFQTGQFVIIRRPGTIEQREYTVYSGEKEDVLEVLVREVTDGKVTPRLKKMKPGEKLEVEICSNCHPFFTGKQRFVDTAGRIDRFRRKYAQFEPK